ncbi:hypothetical protein J3L11_08655 [Shewanella sp. 4t3-1-2LB]|uniref:hypothetical protein n=1 Tax=Shewanella sp. 4t3-1-2LB TaxID=2817682 RepID=UPI001A9830F9|nr:hypothetical protein [Shewanella sp. 4t3-1-2LB]MBO1271709.1 hypothetical protein [Shewanella sp. 4t3-1-2LB]
MTLKTITIENVKGISHLQFDLDIIPNKPSLLVAPNGFGKSSFATAFASLNAAKLKLPAESLHRGTEANKPRLTMVVETAGTTETLVADENSNQILAKFDVHVLSSRLRAKATKRNMGGFTSVSASLEIDQVVLVDRIPQKEQFGYSVAECRKSFGKNGKILKSIDAILGDHNMADKLLQLEPEIKKLSGIRNKKVLNDAVDKINAQNDTTDQILKWSLANVEADLESIQAIRLVADALTNFNGILPTRLDKLLGAFQLFQLHAKDRNKFISACKYSNYLAKKHNHESIIRSFDTTWKDIKPKEHKGKLVVDFPLAIDISNGQRDSLSFAAWLQKVSAAPASRDCIVIIDEVFDYLDDANLVAVQYYISNLIKEKKAIANRVYPLILTHLNPLYFKNFTFKDQKVYFLKKYQPSINEHFRKLILKRSDPSIKAGVDRHHLHFEPSDVNLRNDFKALGLKETWGESVIFHAHLESEWKKYLANQDDYDPFAICCYARVKIEERVYMRLPDLNLKASFLNENGTRNKLELAESGGVPVDDVMYLLGVIYNEGMHIREHVDNSSPIVAKLENLTIRKMLIECVDG